MSINAIFYLDQDMLLPSNILVLTEELVNQ
jgi:hypothetical protein